MVINDPTFDIQEAYRKIIRNPSQNFKKLNEFSHNLALRYMKKKHPASMAEMVDAADLGSVE